MHGEVIGLAKDRTDEVLTVLLTAALDVHQYRRRQRVRAGSSARSCTATFTLLPGYTLTIQKTGSGSAGSTVTSTPGGIACGATCAASYTSGTSVQLTAVAASGYQFVGWQGTGCTTGTVTMTGALTCTAVFQTTPCDPTGGLQTNCRTLGGTWNSATCSCSHVNQDPLLLALDGGALDLTDLAHGVRFDADGDGVAEQVAWTMAGSRVGLLALDLNGNGVIETGAELFAGPPSGPIRGRAPTDLENSFTLLAANDSPGQGGNGDGVISAADAVFGRLRLWVDGNHDGVSQPGELLTLPEAGIASIELTYQPTGRRDGLGNYYRYRGNVHLTSGRQVPLWDVFLATQAPETQCPAAGGAPEGAGSAARQQGDSASDWADAIEEDGLWAGGDGDAVVSPASPALDGEPTPLQVVEYYHLDALGSVRAVTDAQGQVLRRHDFLPFGEELSAQIPPADRRLFTGQERDVETGLDYFHARQLRVDLGRFTTPDPMADLAWTDPMLGASNAYGYVGGNPLGFTDPSGACWICDLFHVAHQAWDALTQTPRFSTSTTVTGTMPPDVAVPIGGLRGAPPIAGGGGGDPGTEPQPPDKKNGKCPENVKRFVDAHLQDAQTLASKLGNGVTPAEVLAVSGNETGYGGGFAGIGNYFGLHGSGPQGTYYTPKNHTPVAKFSVETGFLASGSVFVNNVSSYMTPGMGENPLGFFTILNQHGYATGNSNYPAYMVAAGSNSGPYTLVGNCLGGR